MKSKFALILSLVIALLSCEEQHDLARTFLVKKGEHYSTPRLVESMQNNELRFRARFNESAIYAFNEAGFQDSKNKLLGFADCNSLHHENSARFAWQWYKNELEIHAYCYVNNQRIESYVGTIAINDWNDFSIKVTENNYVFTLNNEIPVTISRGSSCSRGLYYKLWPYFGGTMPAPHDVTVDIIQDY